MTAFKLRISAPHYILFIAFYILYKIRLLHFIVISAHRSFTLFDSTFFTFDIKTKFMRLRLTNQSACFISMYHILCYSKIS